MLLVTRLDRLARSTRDLLNVLSTVVEGSALRSRALGPTPPRPMAHAHRARRLG
nr:hypothetical protein [Rubellimicrobium mesophilum]